MVRCVVSPKSVDERAISYEPVFIYVTTEMHELVNEVHARRGTHQQPPDVRRNEIAQDHATGSRHQDKDYECIRWKDGDPPIHLVPEPHLTVGEELVMI